MFIKVVVRASFAPILKIATPVRLILLFLLKKKHGKHFPLISRWNFMLNIYYYYLKRIIAISTTVEPVVVVKFFHFFITAPIYFISCINCSFTFLTPFFKYLKVQFKSVLMYLCECIVPTRC